MNIYIYIHIYTLKFADGLQVAEHAVRDEVQLGLDLSMFVSSTMHFSYDKRSAWSDSCNDITVFVILLRYLQ